MRFHHLLVGCLFALGSLAFSEAAPRQAVLTCAPGAYVTITNAVDRTTATCAPLRVGKAVKRKVKKQRLAAVNTSQQFQADVVPFKR